MQCPPAPSWFAASAPIIAAVVGGIIAGCIALLGIMWKGKLDRAARIEGEARNERFDVYRRMVSGFLVKTDETAEESKKKLAVDMLLFGSDDATKAWIAILDGVFDKAVKDNTPQAQDLWKTMLLAMRRDASRPETTLTGEDVMAALGIRAGRDPEVSRRRAVAAGLAKPKWEPKDESEH